MTGAAAAVNGSGDGEREMGLAGNRHLHRKEGHFYTPIRGAIFNAD